MIDLMMRNKSSSNSHYQPQIPKLSS